MSTNAYEEMLEYLDGQRKKLADMRERLDEPGVERQYEACLKAYRDLQNSLDWAKEKGRAEGRTENEKNIAIEIAKNLLEMGMSIDNIMKATGLSQEELISFKILHG